MNLIKKGAEADIFEKDNGILLKLRTPKRYRVTELDVRLRNKRTRAEAKNLERAKKAHVNVPNVIAAHPLKGELLIEKVEGMVARDVIGKKNYALVAEKIGEQVALLHMAGIIHGDLTTSNMVVTQENNVFLIDFGLASSTSKPEDKAVDLRLFEEMVKSTHREFGEEMFDLFLRAYGRKYLDCSPVLERLAKIQQRGRYKEHEA